MYNLPHDWSLRGQGEPIHVWACEQVHGLVRTREKQGTRDSAHIWYCIFDYLDCPINLSPNSSPLEQYVNPFHEEDINSSKPPSASTLPIPYPPTRPPPPILISALFYSFPKYPFPERAREAEMSVKVEFNIQKAIHCRHIIVSVLKVAVKSLRSQIFICF